jgi:hypothetical protein
MMMQTILSVVRWLSAIDQLDGEPSGSNENSARRPGQSAKEPAQRRHRFVQAVLVSTELWMGGISLR